MKEYITRREKVINYVTEKMEAQGISRADTIKSTTAIYFFGSNDVENLYKAITSDLPENVIAGIVAHDFNGLANRDRGFAPKSEQFA